jgi:NAD(P)H dehydrogenase (quinone)
MPIAVTGSTGRLGGRVARLLAAQGAEQRLLVRDPARAPELPRAQVVQASYADHDAVLRGLAGVDVALMVSGSESANRLDEHRSFVDAAAEAGVRHLVYTSFCGVRPDATFTLVRDHHHTEQHIESSGMAWTFLRDNLYLSFFLELAGGDGVLRGPADDGRVAAVAHDDVAAAATAVLSDPSSHERRAYELTGPEAITLTEAADTMTRVLGRSYTFYDETLEEAYASRSSYGVPDWQVDAWVSTYTAIAAGELSRVTDDVERLTGRPPRSLADVLGDRA